MVINMFIYYLLLGAAEWPAGVPHGSGYRKDWLLLNSQLFHSRALEQEAVGSFHLTVTWETQILCTFPVVEAGNSGHYLTRVIDTGFARNCRPFLIRSKGRMKSFLPIMGVKSCLAPAWAFAMALGDGRFRHWMVCPDMGLRECELSWSTETMSRAATWRLSGVVEREAPGWEIEQGQ